MATAFQPAPHWDQSVPLSHEPLPLANRGLFDASYSYDPSQAPREPSDHARRRPSQHAATLDVDSYQSDYIKRDSGRSMKGERNTSRNPSPQKAVSGHARRPSASQAARPSAPIPVPRSDSQTTLDHEDRNAWIHRDKLARIESQEMAAAGFAIRAPSHHSHSRTHSRSHSRSHSRPASRPVSRAANSRAHSIDRHAGHAALPVDSNSPSIPAFEDNATQGATQDDDSDDYEERLREEPRVDRFYSKSLPRPSVSRIPVARASPAPLSQSVVERDSLLPRSTQASTSVTSRLGDSANSRTRSRSLGSPTMMNESGSVRSAVPAKPRPRSSHLQDSPGIANTPSLGAASKTQSLNSSTRGKAQNKAATNSLGKKSGNARTATKTGSVTNKNTPTRRPTSNSDKPRPTSLHSRPEGDAPWIAHMYKPDPRLPPDQQMLPTHVKRLQSGNPGETSNSFPKDFDSLDDEELARMGALPPPESALPPKSESPRQSETTTAPPWPLTTNKSEAKSQADSSLQRSGSGYKITPTIESPSSMSRPAEKPEAPRPQKPTVQRMPDPDEKEDGKQKKKLACCIVM